MACWLEAEVILNDCVNITINYGVLRTIDDVLCDLGKLGELSSKNKINRCTA